MNLGVYFTYISGDNMLGDPPVPVSNTVVKPRTAHGSWTKGPARVGCCQIFIFLFHRLELAALVVWSMWLGVTLSNWLRLSPILG